MDGQHYDPQDSASIAASRCKNYKLSTDLHVGLPLYCCQYDLLRWSYTRLDVWHRVRSCDTWSFLSNTSSTVWPTNNTEQPILLTTHNNLYTTMCFSLQRDLHTAAWLSLAANITNTSHSMWELFYLAKYIQTDSTSQHHCNTSIHNKTCMVFLTMYLVDGP